MPSHSPATCPRFNIAVTREERERIIALAHVRALPASDIARALLAKEAARYSAEIDAYLALRASAINRELEAA